MSLPRYRLLATDLDGTLLDSQGRIDDRDRGALIELGRRGIATTICTGRLYSGTREAAFQVAVDGPVACIDGSHVLSTRGDRELMAQPIPSEAHESLRAALAKSGSATFVFAGDEVRHDDDGTEHLEYVSIWSRRLVKVDDVFDEESWCEARPAALVAVGNAMQIDAGARAVEGNAHVQSVTFPVRRLQRTGLWGMIVRARGATKGTALRWIADHYGVALEEVLAVGDWINDIPMFGAAGRSFAMAQAPEEVKAAATEVLDADGESGGGILEAARRAGLL